ncbi:YciN family protein [Edaphovirga cremea]|uniref:YciN family protein n=1 Tax=Edaphovirga cremea TaxID=2267246 RepID=UPI003CCC53F6
MAIVLGVTILRGNTSPITREALLMEANNIIRQHEDYLHGMIATEVDQKGEVLVFRGEFFLDPDGLPTAKTTAVFNMFKHLAHVLSEKYHLEN